MVDEELVCVKDTSSATPCVVPPSPTGEGFIIVILSPLKPIFLSRKAGEELSYQLYGYNAERKQKRYFQLLVAERSSS